MLEKRIRVARGQEIADLVLKNGTIVNVFTGELEKADVAVCEGVIVGVGSYAGIMEVDCTGKYIAPGFIDGHIHLESSMMQPYQFARTVLPHGTTAVITDPHEIANVCGREGIDYMLKSTKDLPLDVFFVLPSCVPAAPLDESGACLEAEDLKPYYLEKRVVGLAEVMNYVGVVGCDSQVLQKIRDAVRKEKIVDGHAPGLTGADLCAYITAGVQSDHECSSAQEAMERARRGQWVMVREGTAAKNLKDLMPLFQSPFNQRAMLVTDDKHPSDLLEKGHIDYIIREAVRMGANPCDAIRMGSLNAANYFGLKNLGAVAPNYQADLVILKDLETIEVEAVYKRGAIVAGRGEAVTFKPAVINTKLKDSVYHSFNMRRLEEDRFILGGPEKEGCKMRVITLTPGQILTTETIETYRSQNDGVCVEKDIIKLAVIERHLRTDHMGLGYVKGYGLKDGAIASSVAHDSHNLIVAGTNAADMCAAANCVRHIQGGWAVARGGEVIASLPLPVAGLMSDLDAESLVKEIRMMKAEAAKLGVDEGVDPFMTLAFVSLPVIPLLRLTTSGLVDAVKQELLDVLIP